MEEPLSTAAVAEAASLGAPGEKALRVLRLGRREIVVRPPGIRDPRSHVAFVLLSVQALGQIALGFELSIAQILLSIGTCALISVVSTWRMSAASSADLPRTRYEADDPATGPPG